MRPLTYAPAVLWFSEHRIRAVDVDTRSRDRGLTRTIWQDAGLRMSYAGMSPAHALSIYVCESFHLCLLVHCCSWKTVQRVAHSAANFLPAYDQALHPPWTVDLSTTRGAQQPLLLQRRR